MPAPEALPTTRLGLTDMYVTRAGFGAWAIGGADWAFGWGPQDDAEAVEAIRAAVRAGVNWVDTAAVYGLGHSEELVARALADLPEDERPYVFTKCGLAWDVNDPTRRPARVGAPDSIRAEADASLRRLRVERIDLYQLHWPPEDGTSVADAVGTLHELRSAGKIRAVGVSNLSVSQLEEAATVGGTDVLQPPFSLVNRQAAADLLPYCAMRDIGVIVYSPMQSGLLSGRWTPERTASLPAGDWRREAAEFNPPALDRNLALVEALRPVADRHDTTVAAVAVAWTLSFDGVTAAIVGARRPDQIDAWLPAAGGVTLTAVDLDEIAAAIERFGAGAGLARQSPALPGSALV